MSLLVGSVAAIDNYESSFLFNIYILFKIFTGNRKPRREPGDSQIWAIYFSLLVLLFLLLALLLDDFKRFFTTL